VHPLRAASRRTLPLLVLYGMTSCGRLRTLWVRQLRDWQHYAPVHTAAILLHEEYSSSLCLHSRTAALVSLQQRKYSVFQVLKYVVRLALILGGTRSCALLLLEQHTGHATAALC
jgi:hypothetical protein